MELIYNTPEVKRMAPKNIHIFNSKPEFDLDFMNTEFKFIQKVPEKEKKIEVYTGKKIKNNCNNLF